jgi:cytochrome o ubiquinol oxidase subunit 1
VPQISDINEGGKMNLLGKLDWSAVPFDQPIIMGASGGVVLATVARDTCLLSISIKSFRRMARS